MYSGHHNLVHENAY